MLRHFLSICLVFPEHRATESTVPKVRTPQLFVSLINVSRSVGISDVQVFRNIDAAYAGATFSAKKSGIPQPFMSLINVSSSARISDVKVFRNIDAAFAGVSSARCQNLESFSNIPEGSGGAHFGYNSARLFLERIGQ